MIILCSRYIDIENFSSISIIVTLNIVFHDNIEILPSPTTQSLKLSQCTQSILPSNHISFAGVEYAIWLDGGTTIQVVSLINHFVMEIVETLLPVEE